MIYPTLHSPELDARVRVRRGRPEMDTGLGWRNLTRSEMLALDAQSVTWRWLLKYGVKRPSPSGTRGYTVARGERKRRPIELTMGDEARARLDALAREKGTSRSAVVEAWLLAAPVNHR